jgi:hypothetical protein
MVVIFGKLSANLDNYFVKRQRKLKRILLFVSLVKVFGRKIM